MIGVSGVGTKSLLRASSISLLFLRSPLLATAITSSPRNPFPRSIGRTDDRGTYLKGSDA